MSVDSKKKKKKKLYQCYINASGLIQYKQCMIAKTGKTHKASYQQFIH